MISFEPSPEIAEMIEKAQKAMGPKVSRTWIIEQCIKRAMAVKWA